MKIEYFYKFYELDDFFKKIILNIKEKKIKIDTNTETNIFYS